MTATITRDDFEVKTARGAVIRTATTFDLAHAFAKVAARTFPGCTVERVTVTVTEERAVVYRPRPRAHDLTVPPIPEGAPA